MHDVDEDVRTIVNYGGRWNGNSGAGTAYRDMRYSPTSIFDTVASNQKIYTNEHYHCVYFKKIIKQFYNYA